MKNILENNPASPLDPRVPKHGRMPSPAEDRENFIKTIPLLEEIVSLKKFPADPEFLRECLISVMEKLDAFADQLAWNCVSFKTVKLKNLRERTAKLLKNWESAKEVNIKLIGESIILSMELSADILEGIRLFGAPWENILIHSKGCTKSFKELLKLY